VLNPDVNTRISKLETRDLACEHLALRTECTARKRDDGAGILGLAASAPDESGQEKDCGTNVGSHEGASLRHAAMPS
jgi:hypothetical protein